MISTYDIYLDALREVIYWIRSFEAVYQMMKCPEFKLPKSLWLFVAAIAGMSQLRVSIYHTYSYNNVTEYLI